MTTTKFFYSASLLPHRLNYMVGLLSVYDFISNSPLQLISSKNIYYIDHEQILEPITMTYRYRPFTWQLI